MHIIMCLALIALVVLLLVGLGPMNILTGILIVVTSALGALALAGIGYALYSARRRRDEDETGGGLETLICPYCRASIARDSVVCPSCYRDLKGNCPTCGQIVTVSQVACPRCNSNLGPALAQRGANIARGQA